MADSKAETQAEKDAAKAEKEAAKQREKEAKQRAQDQADAEKAQREAEGKAAAEREENLKRVEKAEAAAAKAQAAADEANRKAAELQAQLNEVRADAKLKPVAVMRIRSTALNAEKAAAKIEAIWPAADYKRQSPIAALAAKRSVPLKAVVDAIGKTYEVTPSGPLAVKMGLQKAIVENCSDEGDAKAAYFRANNTDGYKVHLDVKRITDPAGAAVA